MSPVPRQDRSISVIIPTRDRVDFLHCAVSSALRQSCLPGELVVVDDGGRLPDDFSLPQLSAVETRLIRIPHEGISAARQTGFAASRGDLLMFLDDDDELVPEALELLATRLLDHPLAVAIAGTNDLIDAAGRRIGARRTIPPGDFGERLWRGNQVANMGCALIRRDALVRCGGWDIDVQSAVDYLLWLKLAQCGPLIAIPEVVLRWRIHGGNLTLKGNQFLHGPAFRRALRRAIPDLAGGARESAALASMIELHAEDAVIYWLRLVASGRWWTAAKRSVPMARATWMALVTPATRGPLLRALGSVWRRLWRWVIGVSRSFVSGPA